MQSSLASRVYDNAWPKLIYARGTSNTQSNFLESPISRNSQVVSTLSEVLELGDGGLSYPPNMTHRHRMVNQVFDSQGCILVYVRSQRPFRVLGNYTGMPPTSASESEQEVIEVAHSQFNCGSLKSEGKVQSTLERNPMSLEWRRSSATGYSRV